jgi:hypothetical protein
MSRPRLQLACRLASAIVLAALLFSVDDFAVCCLPHSMARVHWSVLAQARDLAMCYDLLSFVIGSTMCAVCLWAGVRMPGFLVGCTLLAFLLFAIIFQFSPAFNSA